MNSLKIGKVIYSILANTKVITDRIGKKIYPLIADSDTSFPFIVYKRTEAGKDSTKDRLYKEEAIIEIIVAADKYYDSIDIASDVVEALNYKKGTYGDIQVKGIYFEDADEDYIENTFLQKLNFKIIL